MKRFHVVSEEEILRGRVTDVYFERTRRILEAKGLDPHVTMEASARSLPRGDWGVFCGLHEALELLKGRPVDVWALPEGTLFRPGEPVLRISGNYREFCVYETALLGFLCQASGIATQAARCVIAAQGRPVVHFGARRVHPAIAPMVERAAFVGGCSGVSTLVGGELLGEEPVGTIPHALVLILGDSASATLAFDEVIEEGVERVALVDTFGDEKFEALECAELLEGNIYAVRLDTAASRRGDLLAIAKEVRWELDLHGYSDVKIFLSGGLTEDDLPALNEVADAYGIGTAISAARAVDFGLDIVEVDGEPVAKRGKASGAKQLWVCPECGHRALTLGTEGTRSCPDCDTEMSPQLLPFLEGGELVRDLPSPREIREYVRSRLPESL